MNNVKGPKTKASLVVTELSSDLGHAFDTVIEHYERVKEAQQLRFEASSLAVDNQMAVSASVQARARNVSGLKEKKI